MLQQASSPPRGQLGKTRKTGGFAVPWLGREPAISRKAKKGAPKLFWGGSMPIKPTYLSLYYSTRKNSENAGKLFFSNRVKTDKNRSSKLVQKD